MRLCPTVASVLCGSILLAGCDKPPPPPKPDGSSGIRGVCLLPAEPPDKDGKIPERKRWAGITVTAQHTNHSSNDPTWNLKYPAKVDADGKFELALNPGDYVIFPNDPTRLKDVAISPVFFKVEPGQYTDFVLDYDKIPMTKVRGR